MSLKITSNILELILGDKKSRLIGISISIFTAILLLVTLVLSEYQKQDIRKSQLEIEKNRISQIDKQLSSLYNKTYIESDSLNNGTSKFLKQIEFLREQREEAEKNLDNINKNPDAQILVFTIIAALISIVIITFFTLSLKGTSAISNRKPYEILLELNQGKNLRNIDFIKWITTNELADKNLNGLDIKKAKILKEIYDLSETLNEKRSHFLTLIVEYVDLKRNEEEIKSDRLSTILSSFSDSQDRLKDEIARLNRHAIINLLLCFLIAFFMIGIISYTSFFSHDYRNLKDWNNFAVKIIPKIISILSLLTIFLYFVRMYKANIIDVKYYQNELTNIDLKFIAVKTALLNQEKDTLNKLISDFSNSERNQLLTKDSTTSELERIKLENEINKDYLNKVWDLLSLSKLKD